MKKVLFLLSAVISINLYSQGCSDAGFCSLYNTAPLSSLFEKRTNINSMRVGFSYGKSDNNINVYNPFIEYARSINKNIAINAKINFLAHSGNAIETGEIGDVFLTGDFNLEPDFKVTTGFKIPLHLGNKIKKGVILPMDYQPTLGTLDFLFAIQKSFNNLGLGIGFQMPLTQNDNKFNSNNFVSSEDFQTTNGYFRNPDLWFRLAYEMNLNNKITLIPSVLPIFHLAEDSYINSFGQRTKINGSSGTTLNTSIQLDYKICKNTIVGLNGALPIVTRSARPDGLTRKYVLTLDYRVSF